MRDIRFRAWHIDIDGNTYMDLPSEVDVLNPVAITLNGIVLELQEENLTINTAEPAKTFPPGSIELMQFTGLKDVNGKEIYEGDILVPGLTEYFDARYHEAGPLVVEWEHAGFKPFTENEDADTQPLYHNFEVIGNIYENKELLK